MIRREITFSDFDGNDVTEVHYFHLRQTDLVKLELLSEGGATDMLKNIVASGDPKLIMDTFKKFIGVAYGVRPDDKPNSFIKSDELEAEFLNSLAFDQLFLELMTVPEKTREFIVGIMPAQLMKGIDLDAVLSGEEVEVRLPAAVEDAQARVKENEASGLDRPRDNQGKLWPWWNREPTSNELQKMGQDCMLDVYRRKNSPWEPPVSADV